MFAVEFVHNLQIRQTIIDERSYRLFQLFHLWQALQVKGKRLESSRVV